MEEIVVLGGYGRLGRLCVAELARTTRAGVVVAGPNIQLAQQVAAACGKRARALYCNVTDDRTFENHLSGAAAIVACGGDDLLKVLDVAIRARVPFIALAPVNMETRTRSEYQKRSWGAQVPVILDAGAVPGLPGVLAEYFVRRFPELHEIRIASTGPWLESETARQSHRVRQAAIESETRSWKPLRWPFPQPIGPRWVRPAHSSDLTGFAESHCVERVVYLEPERGTLGRIVARRESARFCLTAEAQLERKNRGPRPRVTLLAADPLHAAVAATGTLVGRILRGRMPAGFFTPREALNPILFLQGLEKRGVQVAGFRP